ncbi:DUF5784 family protein [Halorutilales archaeon Cl-col2-1]
MAGPLRFRRSRQNWSRKRVEESLLKPLDSKIGARITGGFDVPEAYSSCRFEMDNGDIALFAWKNDAREGYWLGNTQTPEVLWDTDKYRFGHDAVPYGISRGAQRELLGEIEERMPWISSYPYLSWFFLPVLLSKDGRKTVPDFFRENAAGFPDATHDDAASFYEEFLSTGILDDHRYEMSTKVGTSSELDLTRMASAMSEFTTARILTEAGYEITPEIDVDTGHSLDFHAESSDGVRDDPLLIEVTRPLPPDRRSANCPVEAVHETVDAKSNGQLRDHDAVLFVDCSNFGDDDWESVVESKPSLSHKPSVVFRTLPDRDSHTRAYLDGFTSLNINSVVDWV